MAKKIEKASWIKSVDNKVVLVLLALMMALLGYFVVLDKNNVNVDAEKMHLDYAEVSRNNVFVYTDIDTVLKIFKEGTGVVYFGFPICPWCQGVTPLLNKAAHNTGVKKIYYYNPIETRGENTPKYKELVGYLKDYLSEDDEGNKRLFVPDTYVVKNGKIVGQANEMAKENDDVKTYFTKEKKKELIKVYEDIMKKL